VARYFQRASESAGGSDLQWAQTLRRLLLGAVLGGVALLGTWAAIQQAPTWAHEKFGREFPHAKSYTQIASASGAIFGTILAALLGDWIGRRLAYFLLCVTSFGSALMLYQTTRSLDAWFIVAAFLAGGLTASFYGWLPLYLPELFPTRVRATGQGFSFNFGRIIAAIGALQGGFLISVVYKGDYETVCSIMSLVYVVGMVVIWLAPETRGQPLPE
jgi:MFS family permease